MTQYAKRDIKRLDQEGGHYQSHVSAMTEENLHFKSDIAAELAWRDWGYAKCAAELDQAKLEIERLRAPITSCGLHELSEAELARTDDGWLWWMSEYPEEGSCGPYETCEGAVDALKQASCTLSIESIARLAAQLDQAKAEIERQTARARNAEHETLKESARATLWEGIATRRSDKITASLEGSDQTATNEIRAGYVQIITAICRDWVEQAPRFMEVHTEDSQGKLIMTVRKYETPSPVQLLVKTEKEIEERDATIREQAAEIERLRERVGVLMQPLPSIPPEHERFPWEMMRLWCLNRTEEKTLERQALAERDATIRELREALTAIANQSAELNPGTGSMWQLLRHQLKRCSTLARETLERSKT